MKSLATALKTLCMLLGAALISAPAIAKQPNWLDADQGKSEQKHGKGHEKHDKEDKHSMNDDRDQHDDRRQGDRNDRHISNHYFTAQHRTVVVDYYTNEFRSKGCPPGLAKKKNGCLPPGQAKKWKRGSALPRDVIYEEVPQRVISIIGAPPSGHKFVRVANDILLIAIATSMVIDAIDDLNRL